jgi:hypothetical protein
MRGKKRKLYAKVIYITPFILTQVIRVGNKPWAIVTPIPLPARGERGDLSGATSSPSPCNGEGSGGGKVPSPRVERGFRGEVNKAYIRIQFSICINTPLQKKLPDDLGNTVLQGAI